MPERNIFHRGPWPVPTLLLRVAPASAWPLRQGLEVASWAFGDEWLLQHGWSGPPHCHCPSLVGTPTHTAKSDPLCVPTHVCYWGNNHLLYIKNVKYHPKSSTKVRFLKSSDLWGEKESISLPLTMEVGFLPPPISCLQDSMQVTI